MPIADVVTGSEKSQSPSTGPPVDSGISVPGYLPISPDGITSNGHIPREAPESEIQNTAGGLGACPSSPMLKFENASPEDSQPSENSDYVDHLIDGYLNVADDITLLQDVDFDHLFDNIPVQDASSSTEAQGWSELESALTDLDRLMEEAPVYPDTELQIQYTSPPTAFTTNGLDSKHRITSSKNSWYYELFTS